MSTRDRIKRSIEILLHQIEDAAYDHDLTENVRSDLKWLHLGIENALNGFNRPTGPDPLTDGGPTVEELFEAQFGDGGPTRDDLEGTVTHDIG